MEKVTVSHRCRAREGRGRRERRKRKRKGGKRKRKGRNKRGKQGRDGEERGVGKGEAVVKNVRRIERGGVSKTWQRVLPAGNQLQDSCSIIFLLLIK